MPRERKTKHKVEQSNVPQSCLLIRPEIFRNKMEEAKVEQTTKKHQKQKNKKKQEALSKPSHLNNAKKAMMQVKALEEEETDFDDSPDVNSINEEATIYSEVAKKYKRLAEQLHVQHALLSPANATASSVANTTTATNTSSSASATSSDSS